MQPTDSSSEKFSGALLNAIIFVGIMAGMTFLLVLLFWLKCYRIIYGYMTFAVFDIFALITAFIAIEVLQVGVRWEPASCIRSQMLTLTHHSAMLMCPAVEFLASRKYSKYHVALLLSCVDIWYEVHGSVHSLTAACWLEYSPGLEHPC
jgi:hypothetical protein